MSVVTIPARTLRTAVAPIERVDVRDPSGTPDGSWTISGYAAVFNQETTLFDAYGLRLRERIASDAFGGVLSRLSAGDGLVHLNHGHDMKSAVASTDVARASDGALPIGGLELSQDAHGLRFFARVDAQDPDAVRMAAKMRRGVVNQASFAFTIDDEALLEDRDLPDGTVDQLWEISAVRDLFDVCVCAQGAYPQTESHLRSMTAASLRVPVLELEGSRQPGGEDARGGQGQRDGVPGPSDVSDPVGSGEADRERRRIELKARAAAAHH